MISCQSVSLNLKICVSSGHLGLAEMCLFFFSKNTTTSVLQKRYLRRSLILIICISPLLGLLNPLDSPHHMRIDEESDYREGIVLDRPTKQGQGSLVNCGMRKVSIYIFIEVTALCEGEYRQQGFN